jgi:hypothetical protein
MSVTRRSVLGGLFSIVYIPPGRARQQPQTKMTARQAYYQALVRRQKRKKPA